MISLVPKSESDAPHLAPGAMIEGKYRIEQRIGSGGMGVVVRAMHLGLEEPVAIKFLHAVLVHDAAHVQRFMREAKAVVRIKSEHVPAVIDAGVLPTGEPYIVMELLVGDDLRAWTKGSRALPVAEAVEYVVQACRGLGEAHRAGVVHRDLKPANLFRTRRADGTPLIKILDFGISKLTTGADDGLTAPGQVLGSPVYMSPEQIRDVRRVDARSDIWALGCILYKLISGEAPFTGPTSAGTLARIVADTPASLTTGRPDVPVEIDRIVLRCLAKRPEERFQRAEDLASSLAHTLALLGHAPASDDIDDDETQIAVLPRIEDHVTEPLPERKLAAPSVVAPPSAPAHTALVVALVTACVALAIIVTHLRR